MKCYEKLAWDSAHFELPVGKADLATVGYDELGQVLSLAQSDGIKLLYLSAEPSQTMPTDLLRKFSGKLVDQKVTFYKSLTDFDTSSAEMERETLRISEHNFLEPNSELISLAVSAGEFSRFRIDDMIPKGKFSLMYDLWMRRSASEETSDVVLTAHSLGGELAGVVTIEKDDKVGKTVLVAVHELYRGQGVGQKLMARAHEWMKRSGLVRATVVTQSNNEAACRLYRKSGYRIEKTQSIYHFWL